MDLPPRAGGRLTILPALFLLFTACATEASDTEVCEGFPDWQTSPYILPYPVGKQYLVDQANCSPPGNGHRGVGRYAYDFLMPVGTPVVVARTWTVLRVEESHFDGEVAATGLDNFVVIGHEDGTADLYGHLTHDGADVTVGQMVSAGDPLGRSGNTGNTGNKPHLHLSQHTCDPFAFGSNACPTLPVTFRNTDANPQGLIRGRQYEAR